MATLSPKFATGKPGSVEDTGTATPQPLLNNDADALAAQPVVAAPLSVWAATTTLTQNILGAGVLALPYAIKSAGLVGGLVLLGFIYVLTLFSMGMLVLLANHLNEFSYQALSRKTLGGHWPAAIEVWVICYTFGCCTSYPILLGDILYQFAKALGAGPWSSQLLWMTAAVVLVCWPLSCANTLGRLKMVSACGLAGICFTVVAVLKRYIDGTYGEPGSQHLEALDLQSFGSCFPILVTALGAHYNVPALFREVSPNCDRSESRITSDAGQRGWKNMCSVLMYAVTISTLIYGVVGVTVYATFGSGTHPDFTENFLPSDVWLVIVRGMLALAICAAFPLTMISTRTSLFDSVVQLWRARNGGNGDGSSRELGRLVMTTTTRIIVSTVATGLCFLMAACAGDIGIVLAYNGSVFGTPVCYIAPAVMYLGLPRHEQRMPVRISSILCAIAGVAFGVLGVIEVTIIHFGKK